MSTAHPDQTWWSAAEIAEAGLPDMPRTTQKVTAFARRNQWRSNLDRARRRSGRGGGWEYHYELFPMRAQKALIAAATPAPAPQNRNAAWQWFDTLTSEHKAKAQFRLDCLMKVEALRRAGYTKKDAAKQVARQNDLSERVIWKWFAHVFLMRRDDWLPALADHRAGGNSNAPKAKVSDEFWDYIRSDYLRPERPNFTACYRRAVKVARAKGWQVASEITMRRRLHKEVSPASQVLAREGQDRLAMMYPAQRRDKSALSAMEAVNADYHRFDVFVRWPADAGAPAGEIVRAQMCAFQDIYSGRILSWRLDKTPNRVGVSLALGDMIEEFGIPEHVLFDNGREFANKFLTGGVPTRYRFKVKEDDIPGILLTLGCKVHWAQPYSGQSKPIERAFRDMCDDIAKDPRFAGAYTGNRPDAKPENYQDRAVDLEQFLTVVSEGIAEHNARSGRRSEIAAGRSFNETFNESYARSPIRRATAEQRRLWLMGAEGLTCRKGSGEIHFMGSVYHEPWMHELAGQKVVARFDPADLHAGLMIYDMDGRFVGQANCLQKGQFFSLDEGRLHAAAVKRVRKAEKEALKAHQKLTAAELGQLLDETPESDVAAIVEAKVIRPVIPARAPAEAKPMDAELEAIHKATVASIEKAREAKAGADHHAHEDGRAKLRALLEIEARIDGGEEVSKEQTAWAESWKRSAEYRAEMKLYSTMGRAIFGE